MWRRIMAVGVAQRPDRPDKETQMTCYMRQMAWLIQAVDMEDTPKERRRLDDAIRVALRIPSEDHCPEVWSAIKALDDDGRAALIAETRVLLVPQPGE